MNIGWFGKIGAGGWEAISTSIAPQPFQSGSGFRPIETIQYRVGVSIPLSNPVKKNSTTFDDNAIQPECPGFETNL